MKTPFVWIVVFFRVVAVCVALYGLFTTFSVLVFASFSGGGMSVPMMFLRLLLVYFVAAIVLWVLSRPLAGVITGDLDRA